MNFNTNNTGTGTNSRPSSIFLKEYSVKCRYCGAEKKYATSSENKIKPRLRCNCGGRYQDGKSRMHREWDILDNGNGFSNNGFIPSIDNVSEQSIYNQILALPTKYPNNNIKNLYSEKLKSISPNPNSLKNNEFVPIAPQISNVFELSKPLNNENDNLKEFCKKCGKDFSKKFKGLKNSHEEYCQGVCPPGATWNNISKKKQ